MSTDKEEKKEGKVKEMIAPDTTQAKAEETPLHYEITQDGINIFIDVANTAIPSPHLRQAVFSALQAQLKAVFAESDKK